MVRVSLKGIHRVRRSFSGKTVEYHSIRGVPKSTFWKTGDSPIGSPEYVDAYRAAKRPPKADTFSAVIDAYLASPQFRKKAERTRRDYLRMADIVRAKFGSAPTAAFGSPKIRHVAIKWRDGIESAKTAQYAWTILRLIVGWGYDRGLVPEHHLRGGETVYRSDRAEIIWTEADLAAFDAAAPEYLSRALRAAAETGLRPGDLVTLTRFNVHQTPHGRRIQVRTAKRGRVAAVPVTERMARIIDTASGERILSNDHGGPLSVEWLSKAVKKYARKAGLDERLRLYDARGTACTRLLMAGASLPELALHMGWSLKTAATMIETYAALDPAMTDSVLVRLEKVRKG